MNDDKNSGADKIVASDDGLEHEDYDDGLEPECHTCGGDGYTEANEAYCDWVNYGDELVTCPNCRGSGLRKDCTVF